MRHEAIARLFDERVGAAKEKYNRIISLASARLNRVVDAAEEEILAMEKDLLARG
jgi:hypothetical protein